MRTAFIEQLLVEARKKSNIFLVVGDLGFSVVEPFRDELPHQFLNVGVAEQNMVGIASGLAKEGFKVFVYSIGNFPTLRAMEQIRYDVCYHHLDVKIIAVGGGFAYGPLGPSHHATEEIGMLRTIPDLSVCAPGDPIETKRLTNLLCQNDSPVYMRLGKAGEPVVHPDDLSLFWGAPVNVLTGSTTVIFTTGSMLNYAYTYIKHHQLNCGLISFPFVKPIHSDRLREMTEKYTRIITIEEHQRSGGFGSAILEAYHDMMEHNLLKHLPAITRIAIPDKFASVAGTQDYLRERMGLTLDNLSVP